MLAEGWKSKENQKEMLEIKNTATEMKNAFDVLISNLDMAEERISELVNISIESSEMEKQRGKRIKQKQNRISKDCGTATKCVT